MFGYAGVQPECNWTEYHEACAEAVWLQWLQHFHMGCCRLRWAPHTKPLVAAALQGQGHHRTAQLSRPVNAHQLPKVPRIAAHFLDRGDLWRASSEAACLHACSLDAQMSARISMRGKRLGCFYARWQGFGRASGAPAGAAASRMPCTLSIRHGAGAMLAARARAELLDPRPCAWPIPPPLTPSGPQRPACAPATGCTPAAPCQS